jgi:phytoene synthase
VLAAAGIYGDIAREVARRGEHAWDHRIVTSKAGKIGWLIRARAQAAARGWRWSAATERPSRLWTRPGR